MRIDENGYSWKSFWDNVGDFFSDTFGINVRTEDSVLTGYYLVGETRTGVGKTTNSGKPINLNITTPKKFWKFWDFSLGVSVKIKDKGIGVNIVGNPGLSYSSGNNSYAVFSNSLGRIGYKHTTYDEDGNYDFNIIELNGPEIVAVYYGAPVIYKIGKYIIDKIPSRPPVPVPGV